MDPGDDAARGRRTKALLAALLFLVAGTVYLPALGHGPVLDDAAFLAPGAIPPASDPLAHLGRGLFAAVRGYGGYYRPLTTFSLAVERDLLGGSLRAHHLGNLLLHAAVATAAFLLLAALLAGTPAATGVAFAAALLFAVHPVLVDAVDPVTGRGDLLAALFLLAAWGALAARRPAPAGAKGRRAWSGARLLGAVLFLAALLSKESAAALPALVLVGAAAPGRREGWRGNLAVLLLVLGGYLALRTAVLGAVVDPRLPDPLDNPLAERGAVGRLAGAPAAWLEGARLLLWPAGMSPDYSGEALAPPRVFLDPRALSGWGLALLLVVALARSARRGGALPLGVALLVFPLLPAANLLFAAPLLFAPRLLYLPALGATLLLAAAAASLCRIPSAGAGGRTAALLLLAAAAAAGAALTWSQHRHYRDDLALWTRASEVAPASPKAWYNLGNSWMRRDRPREAAGAFARAAALRPGLGIAWSNLGVALLAAGEDGRGEEALERALQVDPGLAQPHAALGSLAARRGDLPAARRHLRESLRLDPLQPDAERIRAWLARIEAPPAP